MLDQSPLRKDHFIFILFINYYDFLHSLKVSSFFPQDRLFETYFGTR